jgi:monoamine oxidase
LIHSDLATEPEKTSVSYGLQNYLMNDPAYMKLYGIEGGIERLTVELARRIDATVLLERRVTAIGRGSNGRLQVTSTPRSSAPESPATQSHDFDFVVVALPNNYLPDIQFHGPRLAEAMQRHHAHYDYPAHYLRISILFDRPFWRNKLSDSYFMLDAFGGCCLYDESAREAGAAHGVLGWLLGGQAALQMSDLNDEELIERALNSLPEFLSQGRQFFLEGRVHRWVGAVNGLPGGVPQQVLDQRHQPEPVGHPDLLVVGDYLFDSTLNGVLDSAEYVSHWLAALMANDNGDKA